MVQTVRQAGHRVNMCTVYVMLQLLLLCPGHVGGFWVLPPVQQGLVSGNHCHCLESCVLLPPFMCTGDGCDVHYHNPALRCPVDHVSYPANCGLHLARVCGLPAAQVGWYCRV